MMFVAHFLYLCLTHLPPSPKKASAKRCETKKKFFFFECKKYGTTSRLPLLFLFALLYYERRGTQKGKEKRPRRGEQNLKWAGNLNSAPRLSFFVCKNHTQNHMFEKLGTTSRLPLVFVGPSLIQILSGKVPTRKVTRESLPFFFIVWFPDYRDVSSVVICTSCLPISHWPWDG